MFHFISEQFLPSIKLDIVAGRIVLVILLWLHLMIFFLSHVFCRNLKQNLLSNFPKLFLRVSVNCFQLTGLSMLQYYSYHLCCKKVVFCDVLSIICVVLSSLVLLNRSLRYVLSFQLKPVHIINVIGLKWH